MLFTLKAAMIIKYDLMRMVQDFPEILEYLLQNSTNSCFYKKNIRPREILTLILYFVKIFPLLLLTIWVCSVCM